MGPILKTSLTVIFLFSLTITASATTGSMTLTDPDSGSIISSLKIHVSAYITGTTSNVDSAQVMAWGNPWVTLIETSTGIWEGDVILPNNTGNGATKLIGHFRTSGEPGWKAAENNINIQITLEQPEITTGSVIFTVRDYKGNPVKDVTIQPTGTITDAQGIAIITGQPLQTVGFTFTKNTYDTLTTTLAFTSAARLSQNITMRKPGDDIKKLRVSGYNEYADAGTMVYLRVKDEATGENIDGAKVMLFSGNTVKSIPGNTSAGRVTLSYAEAGYYELVIEKSGYEEWSQTITVLAPKVTATPIPTPTPVPTPAPTPIEKYRADANMKLTDDDYRLWLEAEETRKSQAQQNAFNSSPTIIQPPKDEGLPWGVIGVVGIVCAVGVGSYIKKQKNGEKKDPDPDADILNNYVPPAPITTLKTITCKDNNCDWRIEIPADSSQKIINMYLDEHEKTHKDPE